MYNDISRIYELDRQWACSNFTRTGSGFVRPMAGTGFDATKGKSGFQQGRVLRPRPTSMIRSRNTCLRTQTLVAFASIIAKSSASSLQRIHDRVTLLQRIQIIKSTCEGVWKSKLSGGINEYRALAHKAFRIPLQPMASGYVSWFGCCRSYFGG